MSSSNFFTAFSLSPILPQSSLSFSVRSVSAVVKFLSPLPFFLLVNVLAFLRVLRVSVVSPFPPFLSFPVMKVCIFLRALGVLRGEFFLVSNEGTN